MFALEIDFHDGVSQPETLLVRRPHAFIGTSEFAHVVIEGAAADLAELRIFRQLGDLIHCHSSSRFSHSGSETIADEQFSKVAQLKLGEVTTTITSLDIDLLIHSEESLDRAGLRIVRESLTRPSPFLPAVALIGARPVVVSFPESKVLVVGRSRDCFLRLDASDVSGEHARIGFEDGEFWVEDLGSTNGTFLDGERISGRTAFEVGQKIRFGGETLLMGLKTEAEFLSLQDEVPVKEVNESFIDSFPCMVAMSDVVKPARIAILAGKVLKVGRDPANDIWVGAAHISRSHCEIICREDHSVWIKDLSSNGTFLGGERLVVKEEVELVDRGAVVSFGSGIELVLCRDAQAEQELDSLRLENEEEIEQDSSPEPASALNRTHANFLSGPIVNDHPQGTGVFSKMAAREEKRQTKEAKKIDINKINNFDSEQETGEQKRNIERTIYGDSEFDPDFQSGSGGGKASHVFALLVLLTIIIGLFVWLVGHM